MRRTLSAAGLVLASAAPLSAGVIHNTAPGQPKPLRRAPGWRRRTWGLPAAETAESGLVERLTECHFRTCSGLAGLF